MMYRQIYYQFLKRFKLFLISIAYFHVTVQNQKFSFAHSNFTKKGQFDSLSTAIQRSKVSLNLTITHIQSQQLNGLQKLFNSCNMNSSISYPMHKWFRNNDYCNFRGVTCESKNGMSFVTVIKLEGKGLTVSVLIIFTPNINPISFVFKFFLYLLIMFLCSQTSYTARVLFLEILTR